MLYAKCQPFSLGLNVLTRLSLDPDGDSSVDDNLANIFLIKTPVL